MSKKQVSYLQALGAILVVVGATVRLFEADFPVFKYLFSLGAIILIVVAFIHHHQARNEDIRVQRQYRMMLFATAFLGVAGYLMFLNDERWVVLVLMYAVISVFLSFRGKTTKKEK